MRFEIVIIDRNLDKKVRLSNDSEFWSGYGIVEYFNKLYEENGIAVNLLNENIDDHLKVAHYEAELEPFSNNLTIINEGITKYISIGNYLRSSDVADLEKIYSFAAIGRIIRELADEKLIVDIFKGSPNSLICDLVIDRLSDEQFIYDTFKDHPSWLTRLTVVEKLTDQKLITTFKDDSEDTVRMAAVNKLTDEQLLLAFKDDSDDGIREVVVKKLTDPQVIYDNFKDDENYRIRKIVVDKLDDKELLLSFRNDEYWIVTETVLKKLATLD